MSEYLTGIRGGAAVPGDHLDVVHPGQAAVAAVVQHHRRHQEDQEDVQ